jgi:chemotaxis protein CheX
VISVKYLNPFLEAIGNVLQAEAGLNARRAGSLKLSHSSHTTHDVTVLIHMIGHIRGVVIFSMSEDLALTIVGRILDQPFKEFNDLARSGISELGNVIVGQAGMGLAQVGYQVDISVPTLLQGRGMKISTLDLERIIVPIQTEAGALQVDLALRAI